MRFAWVVGVVTAGVWCLFMAHTYRIDLDVYRIGVQTWLDGGDLYGRLPNTAEGENLPFIYPPFAAVLLVPLTVIPFPVATVALTVTSIVLLTITASITSTAVGLSQRWLLLVIAVIFFIEPVRYTLGYGQINIILLALVAADCLIGKPRWPRGLLVGITAAIKLTPLVFLLFFLVRRDRHAMLATMVSFLGATAIGFAVMGRSSVAFWTHEVFHTDEKVTVGFVANQSILGALARLGFGREVWLVLAVVVVALAIWAMRNVSVAMAFAITALTMLLVSPLSWSHHWVWCVPLLLVFATHGHRALALVGVVIFTSRPHWWFEETRPTLAHQIVVDAYCLFALAALVLLAYRSRNRAISAPWCSNSWFIHHTTSMNGTSGSLPSG
ncbi:hypothetical protein ALI144C_52065 [Actinosynnema sp. ALI-1.44]|nr:hypothetical protein ALI144C_52065 [Actinosynnema sp. ALI-1.44]